MEIILASSSKPRLELLEQVGISVVVYPADIDESIYFENERSYKKALQSLARAKANAIKEHFNNHIIIAADTVILYKNKLFQKPSSTEEARDTITQLSGKTHSILTGIYMINTHSKKELTTYSKTLVKFRKLSASEIDNYISTGESMGHAGSYKIQGIAAMFVENIKGSYSNAIGLPLHIVYDYLGRLDNKHSLW